MRKSLAAGLVLFLVLVFPAGLCFASYDVTGGDATIGDLDDTSDGIRFLDAEQRTATVTVNKLIDVIAADPLLSVSTAANNTGTLIFLGNTIVNGDIGEAGAALFEVDVGEAGTASSFGGDINAATLGITGTGVVVLNGNLNGALSYLDDGTVMLADGMAASGPVTNDAATDGQGTLTLEGSGWIFSDVGGSGASLKAVNAGADGGNVSFSGDVHALSLNVTGTGNVAVNGDLNGSLSYEGDGAFMLADGGTITGDVTNDTLNTGQGTLTLAGDGTVMGGVGEPGAALKAVNAGADGTSSVFFSSIYAFDTYITGTGTVAVGGSIIGAVGYQADGELVLGDGATIASAVTNDMMVDGRGTLTLAGSSMLSVQIGDSGASLRAVNAGAAGSTVWFFSDVYAQTMNITGTGDVTLGQGLNGDLSYDADGLVTLADTMAITGDVTNDSGADGQGTLDLVGDGTVSGQVGAAGASLKEVRAGASGKAAVFAGDVYAQAMNVSGTGDVALNGDLNGDLSYGADGTVTLADTMAVTGDVTNDAGVDAQGTLTLAGSGAVSGQVGGAGAALKDVNAGADGSASVFSSDVYTESFNITGTGAAALGGTLNGALSYEGAGTVTLADGMTVTGNVTNDTLTDGQGTLVLAGDSAVLAQIGADGAALGAVDAGADGAAVGFDNDVYAQTLNVTGTGTVALGATLHGAISYDGDGTVALADTMAVTGGVANDTGIDGQGTFDFAGSGTVGGQVGAAGASLKAVSAGVDSTVVTLFDDVYAQALNIMGTGTAALSGDLNGALDYYGDGIVTLSSGGTITGNVTNATLTDAQGILMFLGDGTLAGQAGSALASLKAVNVGGDGTNSLFSGAVYAQAFNITGTGAATVDGDLAGAVSYQGDGTFTLGDNRVLSAAVTNDSGTDGQGTLAFAGNGTMWGQAGAEGASLKAVNAGAAGSIATFSNDIYAQAMGITGTGTVMLNGDLNGNLSFLGDGNLVLADGQEISGTVSNDSGVNFQGELDLVGAHATGGTIGASADAALRLVSIRQGAFTMAHDMAAGLVLVDENSTFALDGDRTISGGSLSVGGSGSSSVDLGDSRLILADGAVNFLPGTTVNLTVNGASSYGQIVQAAADAVVNLGTTINVNIAGYVPQGAVLTVIDGSGGTGVAGGLTVLDNDMIVTFIVSAVAGPDLVLVAAVDYDPAGLGGTTSAVADTLSIIEGQDISADMRAIFTELHGMPDFNAVSQAVTQMRPYEGSALVDQTRAMGFAGRRAAAAHLDLARAGSATPPPARSREEIIGRALDAYQAPEEDDGDDFDDFLEADIWAHAISTDADQGTYRGIQGYTAMARGIIFGVDTLKMDGLLCGFAVGYATSEIDPDQFGIGDIEIKHYPLILYAELHGVMPWRIDAMLSGARNKYKTVRTMRFGTIDRTATGAFDGAQYGLYVEGAYDLPVRSFTFTPSLSLDYNYLSFDTYTEGGADALNLQVKSEAYSYLRSGFGLAASTSWALPRVTVSPRIYSRYQREWLKPSIRTRAAFEGTDTYFETTPVQPSRNTVESGMAWDLLLPKDMSLRFNYDVEVSQEYTSNILSAQFKSKF